MSNIPKRVHVQVVSNWTFDTDIFDIPEGATPQEIQEFFIDVALDGGGPDWDELNATAILEF